MSEYKILYNNINNTIHLKKVADKNKKFNNDQEKLEYMNNIEKVKDFEKKNKKDNKSIKNNNNTNDNINDNTKNNNNNGITNDNTIEIDADEFFSKFNITNQSNNQSNNQPNNQNNDNQSNNQNNDINFMPGPRGMPGLIGPQGPPGPKGDTLSDEQIVEIVKRISRLNGNKEIKINNKLIYGIKKTGITESINYSNNNNNNLKIKKNNNVNNKELFDVFYLSPNILEIIGNSSNNYIHDKKVEVFKNIYDNNEVEYFPLDYLPAGYPINNKLKNNIFNKLIIKNFSWNIMQNINEYTYDELKLIGYVPNGNEYIMTDIELEISIEMHSQSNYELINDRENIFPYRNKFIKLLNPSNTCIYSTKNTKVKINDLNGTLEKNIEINLRNHKYLTSSLLCLKVNLSEDSVYFLKGHNKNNEICYGFVPFNQIIVSFDYELL